MYWKMRINGRRVTTLAIHRQEEIRIGRTWEIPPTERNNDDDDTVRNRVGTFGDRSVGCSHSDRQKMSDDAKTVGDATKQAASDAADATKHAVSEAVDKTKEAASEASDKAKGSADTASDSSKTAAQRAADSTKKEVRMRKMRRRVRPTQPWTAPRNWRAK